MIQTGVQPLDEWELVPRLAAAVGYTAIAQGVASLPATREALCATAAASITRAPGGDPGAHGPWTDSPARLSRCLVPGWEDALGRPVKNLQGEPVGKVEHVILSPRTGLVRYAVVSIGGSTGAG